MKNFDKGTVVRTVLLFIALVNQTLIMFGKTALPINEDQVNTLADALYLAGSTAFTAITSLVAWYKNNYVTSKGKLQKEALKEKGLMHYTATPGASALNELNYFNGTCIKVDNLLGNKTVSKETASTSQLSKSTVTILKKGSTGSKVKALQKRLIKAGFKLPKFGADGHYGDETKQAVLSLQKKAGIAADGIYGPATEKALQTVEAKKKKSSSSGKKSSYKLPSGIYKVKSPMMKGTAVRQIQEALAVLYYYPDKGAKNNGIDGYYGPKTANAVKRFQLMNGLSADGIYGPKTKVKIEALLK